MRVLIAGGGVAALETALALHDLARERVDLTLVAPDEHFVLRPMLVAQPFAKGRASTVPLLRVAAETDARLLHHAVASVDTAEHHLLTTDGERLPYDALVLALGARPATVYRRSLTFSAACDPTDYNDLLRDLEEGHCDRLTFVVPPGATWSLPLYELALMTAKQVRGMGIESLEIHFVTPEEHPLDLFGLAAAADVRRLLGRAGIHLHTGVRARQRQDGALLLEPTDQVLDRTRVVALPELKGPGLPGLPSDEHGFVPVDDFGRVRGVDGVYAAGDMTARPVKQGGLAAQQADAIAEMLAHEAGADIEPTPYRPVLRGTLLTGAEDHHLRDTEHGVGVATSELMWWPPGKVAGAYLAPYLAGEVGERLMDLPPHRASRPIDLPLPGMEAHRV